MAVLLLSRHIDVETRANKDGLYTLFIEKENYAKAVEFLHLHGYPQKKYRNVEDLFPADQLVTSPGQELSKLVYLKEQSLERMLSDMDGVISARVVIAQPLSTDSDTSNEITSVAVFIKYSPDNDLQNSITQIKGLVHDSVPDLNYDKISIVMQPVKYLSFDNQIIKKDGFSSWFEVNLFQILASAVGIAWCIFIGLLLYRGYQQRKAKGGRVQ